MAIARMILAGLQLIAFRRVAPLRLLPGFVSIGLVLLATLGMTTGFELLYGYHLLDFSLTSVVLNCGRWALLCFVIALLVARGWSLWSLSRHRSIPKSFCWPESCAGCRENARLQGHLEHGPCPSAPQAGVFCLLARLGARTLSELAASMTMVPAA
jgi:hypothetical protein